VRKRTDGTAARTQAAALPECPAMNLPSLLLALLVVLPAIGLATWTWFAMSQIEADLLAFEGHQGLDFEI
jgi:hypothetical protein